MENKFEDLKVCINEKSGCEIERNMFFAIGRS